MKKRMTKMKIESEMDSIFFVAWVPKNHVLS